MNEFNGLPKEKLELIKMGLEYYKQGALDSLQILSETYEDLKNKTNELYDEKIALCEEELKKHE